MSTCQVESIPPTIVRIYTTNGISYLYRSNVDGRIYIECKDCLGLKCGRGRFAVLATIHLTSRL